MLTRAARAMLMAEPASVAHALQGGPAAGLVPVFEALLTERRLRNALLQDPASREARAAMLHPDDLSGVLSSSASAS